jgi:hypothetical protein
MMAGEWIAYDLALPSKPEVQELIDLTGEPVECVVFRLLQLWGWASMHCADGTARMTLPRLVRTCGGDEAFWEAVAAVGWLEIDAAEATVAVPGWDRRFSRSAKARIQHADRSRDYEERNPGRKADSAPSGAAAPDDPARERRRGEERIIPPPPREASPIEVWPTLLAAWNDGAGQESRRKLWKPPTPPNGADGVILAPGWLNDALDAIRALPACQYFDSPVPLTQFVRPGFVQKVLGGQYDAPKNKPPARAGEADKPPPKVDPAFAAAREATLAREAARREAEHRRLDQASETKTLAKRLKVAT